MRSILRSADAVSSWGDVLHYLRRGLQPIFCQLSVQRPAGSVPDEPQPGLADEVLLGDDGQPLSRARPAEQVCASWQPGLAT